MSSAVGPTGFTRGSAYPERGLRTLWSSFGHRKTIDSSVPAAGLFYDRPSGNSIYSQVQNPPVYKSVTVRNGQLQTLGSGGLTTDGAPALNAVEYESKLPESWQWNAGVQMMLPWATALDVEYVGQHGFNIIEGVNLNAVDFGSAFQAENQDATLATNTTPGARAVSQDQMRAFRGYGSITQQWSGGRQIQLRVDMFNAPNSAIIDGRNSTINLSNPNDPVTATNLPFDANGNLIESRSRPRGAGFGVANGYQAPRSIQAQVRFSF
jgi:hypothetical protein